MKNLLLLISLFFFNPVSSFASIKYVDSDESSETQKSLEENDIEAINRSEGLSVEQIIMQITAEGFVTSHGDHYHYYNGNVPYDGIFSDQLLAPKEYQLSEETIVSEINKGYVVLIENKYYLYFEDLTGVTNLRTEDEMILQGYGVHPNDAKNIVDLREALGLDHTNKIRYQLELTEAEFNEKDAESILVYLFNQGYVALINDELIVFPKEVPQNSVFDARLLVPEDYVLDKEAIISDTKEGHIVKIDERYALYVNNRDSTKNIKFIK